MLPESQDFTWHVAAFVSALALIWRALGFAMWRPLSSSSCMNDQISSFL